MLTSFARVYQGPGLKDLQSLIRPRLQLRSDTPNQWRMLKKDSPILPAFLPKQADIDVVLHRYKGLPGLLLFLIPVNGTQALLIYRQLDSASVINRCYQLDAYFEADPSQTFSKVQIFTNSLTVKEGERWKETLKLQSGPDGYYWEVETSRVSELPPVPVEEVEIVLETIEESVPTPAPEKVLDEVSSQTEETLKRLLQERALLDIKIAVLKGKRVLEAFHSHVKLKPWLPISQPLWHEAELLMLAISSPAPTAAVIETMAAKLAVVFGVKLD